MQLGLERRQHGGQRRVGWRFHPQPGAQGVAQAGLAQIELNPSPIPKNRVVARVEADGGHFLEASFTTLNLFAAPITPNPMHNYLERSATTIVSG
ncbi:hypothetical protein [Polaromonas sp. YR568]|uniref:hypothetical protein n=1 Tax=Polaromonas sp. YR568 TaxID=1855301 RepID=UPI00313826B0